MKRGLRCRRCGYGIALLVICKDSGLQFKCDFCGYETGVHEDVNDAAHEWKKGGAE